MGRRTAVVTGVQGIGQGPSRARWAASQRTVDTAASVDAADDIGGSHDYC
jgi:hypothetical protein